MNTSCHVDEIPPVLEPADLLEGIPHYVVKRRRKNGQIIYASEILSLINDKQGQIIGVSIIDRDINAGVMAEKMANDELRRGMDTRKLMIRNNDA